MSDALKTAVNLVQSFTFSDGMQPSAKQFENIFSGLTQGLNIFSNVIGPALNSSVSVLTKNKIVSSRKYNSMMIDTERSNFESDAQESILNTFNLTRILGSHSSLNPLYLPGSVHLVASQSSGYPLATDVKVQQLPFPPVEAYDFEIDDDGRTWNQVASPYEASSTEDEYAFHIDSSGTIYTNRLFTAGANIKYDLRIPNTYGPLGSSYNMIPDPSIETLLDGDILSRTGDGTYGRVKLGLRSTGSDYSEWTLVLPPVISLKDPLLTSSTQGVANQGFEPLGVFESTNGKKYYGLNTELYLQSAGGLIDNNTLVLFNAESGKSYFLDWTSANLPGEEAKRTFYASGSTALLTLFKNDAGNLISSNGGYNTKTFYIFAFGTNISDTLSQVNLNFAKHRHDGSDSYRVHHNDLLGAQNEVQGLGDQDGSGGGLDFINRDRQLAYSDAKDNVHPQYFHRLGYRYGGTQGLYEPYASFTKLLDLNAMQGDLLLYPIDSSEKTYLYEDQTAYDAADKTETITWDFSASISDVANFWRRRGHAVIFGWPYDSSASKFAAGATKLYFENGIILDETTLDNKGFSWTLSRHGFIPGDYTSPITRGRGLNIGWGNLFFGYREDIFGGRLTGSLSGQLDANAYFKTGEFNIVTTANKYAGQNTSTKIKQGYNYRDGFAVRALKGSSIWLSAGAESADINDISTGKNNLGIPGTIALEASYPSSRGVVSGSETGVLSLNTLISSDAKGDAMSSGSGIFLAPGPFVDTAGADSYRNPWVAATMDDYKFAALWDSSPLGPVVTGGTLDGFNAGPGPLLDIFALAPDRQKTNATSNGNIPVGTDNSLLGWVFGRPFIRGTYGINFCVNGTFASIDTEFKSGYHRKLADEEWGPNRIVLKTTTNEYIHREFKFWGKNHDTGPSASADSYENTMGGNINLLYNFGRDYNRFGISQVWADNTSLSGAYENLGGVLNSQWSNSRRISLGSSKPEDYGSAIRQASYIEAFKGFRNDPLQPYYANYIIPFTAIHMLESFPGEGINIETEILNKTFVIADNINGMPIAPNDGGTILLLEQVSTSTTLDGLIRGSEEILLQSSSKISQAFPSSLVDFKVKLEYYVGQLADGSSDGVSSTETPHVSGPTYTNIPITGGNGDARCSVTISTTGAYSVTITTPGTGYLAGGARTIYGDDLGGTAPENNLTFNFTVFDSSVSSISSITGTGIVNSYYKRIKTEEVIMTPAAAAKASGVFGHIAIVASNGGYNPVDSDSNKNAIVGYSSAIGVIKNNNLGSPVSGYRSKFPLFESIGRGDIMGAKQFCLLLNIHDRTNENYAINSSVPYRILKGFDDNLFIEFRGTIHITTMTAYNAGVSHDSYPS